MIHLRLVSPPDATADVQALLDCQRAVHNVITIPGAARRPDGDVILCDVAREDASVLLAGLRRLGLEERGSIAIETVDTSMSRAAEHAEAVASGSPADAVVWEEVEASTSETADLSASFLLFMVLATLIAACGIFLDTPILIVGAMVVGPEFGPLAGLCVATVQRRPALARRSATALAVGFPLAILGSLVASAIFRATGLTPDRFSEADHQLGNIIASPDFFAAFVAVCAAIAGMISLSTAKSGALIGVLISVTTIPAAANVGVSAAYGDWDAFRGSLEQLGLNLGAIVVAGTATLYVQRVLYHRRRREVLDDVAPAPASASSSTPAPAPAPPPTA